MDFLVPPSPIYKDIGLRIRARRKALGLRQEGLAKRLRISRGSLANIETGRQSILVHVLYSIAAALQLKPLDLLPLPSEPSVIPLQKLRFSVDLSSKQAEQVARVLGEAAAEQESREEPSGKKR